MFAHKKNKKKDKDSVSVGVRGPMSTRRTVSVSPADINGMRTTENVSGEPTDDDKKNSDTTDSKHMVEFGLYQVKSAANAQLAEGAGFTQEDADTIKEYLHTLFISGSSSTRPDSNVEVLRLCW